MSGDPTTATGWAVAAGALAGVAGGAVGALAGLWGARSQRRADQKEVRRDERRTVYLEFLALVSPMQRRVRTLLVDDVPPSQLITELLEDIQLGLARLKVAATPDVKTAAERYDEALRKAFEVVADADETRDQKIGQSTEVAARHEAIVRAMAADLG